ncbi:hypothetical protein GCM10028814_18800 [Angustibacter aerolatus]
MPLRHDRRVDRPSTTTAHRGRFVHGTCPRCAWIGPGRRALFTAERDAETHAEEHDAPLADPSATTSDPPRSPAG